MQEIAEERPQSRETDSIETSSSRPESRQSNSRSGSDAFPSKRQRGAQDMLIARKQMDEAFSLIKNRCNRRENEKEVNECDLYGQLLAEKLKPLDIDDRLVLMNEIDNLVFKYTMNVRQRDSLRTTAYSPYMNQTQQVVHRQPAHLPGSSTLLIQHPVASQTNIQNSQSVLNYAVPLSSSTPFQDTNAQNNCAIQINLSEDQLSPEAANYALYTSDHNNLYDSNPTTSKNQYKKSVDNDKHINIISQSIIAPRTYDKNIIKEAYNRRDDTDDY